MDGQGEEATGERPCVCIPRTSDLSPSCGEEIQFTFTSFLDSEGVFRSSNSMPVHLSICLRCVETGSGRRIVSIYLSTYTHVNISSTYVYVCAFKIVEEAVPIKGI